MGGQMGQKYRQAEKKLKRSSCDYWELDGVGTPAQKRFVKKSTSKALRRAGKEKIDREVQRAQ